MTLINLLQITRRWLTVILSIIIGTVLVLGWRIHTADPVYTAQVKLQLTAPQEENVMLFDQYRASSVRDEMTVALNNFIEVLQSHEVNQRTIEKLELTGTNKFYELEVQPLRDADFTYVRFQARTPQLVAAIANTHTSEAIAYYGEIRAKPASVAKEFLAREITVAEQQLRTAEEMLTKFKIEHNIASLESEIVNYQSLISQLQLSLDQRAPGGANDPVQATHAVLDQLQRAREEASGRGDTVTVERYDQSIALYQDRLKVLQQDPNATANSSAALAAYQERLARLITLEPKYNDLQMNVERARANYDRLDEKYTEAVIKENTAKIASFIQIVEPALPPQVPATGQGRALLLLGFIGSIGIGLMLALLLDHLAGMRTTKRPSPSNALANSAK